MFRPHVAGGVLVVCGSSLERYELQGLLGVGPDADSGADFSKGGSCFVDLDVEVRGFEQGDAGAEAADAAADDRDAEWLG